MFIIGSTGEEIIKQQQCTAISSVKVINTIYNCRASFNLIEPARFQPE
jgi:hypothetical protein